MAHINARLVREGRRSIRFPTSFRGEVRILGRFYEVVIDDISTGGAMISGDMLPTRGTPVVLRAEDLDVAAVVAWRQDRRCGLSFRSAIEPLAVIRGNVPVLAALKQSAFRDAARRAR